MDTDRETFADQRQGPWLRAIMHREGLTGAAVAALLHVDARSVRRWLADPEASSYRRMPYATQIALTSVLREREASGAGPQTVPPT